ncbi:MAG: efflux RND transporter periplasmic adaptor subunit [Terrimicrobiaceae bacterium]|nr:efflux RND transporter periplasmic adaptor subunit [Terrimicrobiaceae bacterium]
MNNRLEKARDLKLNVPEEPPARSRRWLLWLFLMLIVFGVAFPVFKIAPWRDATSRPVEASTVPLPTASTSATSVDNPAMNTFTAAGYIEPIPPFPIHIAPLVLGRVDEFPIIEGQQVKAGQIIAKLNSQEFKRRYAELNAALGVNAERLLLATRELARSKKLAATGVATARELEHSNADAAVLQAEAVRLQAEMQTIEWQIQEATVRAPVDGVLFERLANVGDYIYSDSNRKIASIYDPAKLQIWVDVNQRDAARLHVGQPVEVTLDAEPGKVFAGKVSRILPRASLSKNTIQAKILLRETSPSLRPDMSVKVTFLNQDAAPIAADKTATVP